MSPAHRGTSLTRSDAEDVRTGLAPAPRTGEHVIDPALAAAPNPLSPRERDVLAVAIDGATVADIARLLHLTERTVRNYLSVAIGKTGARNRTEAARTAARSGWL